MGAGSCEVEGVALYETDARIGCRSVCCREVEGRAPTSPIRELAAGAGSCEVKSWVSTLPIREMGAGSACPLEQGWRKLRFAKTSAAKGKRPARERSVSTRRRSVRELGAGSARPPQSAYMSSFLRLFAQRYGTPRQYLEMLGVDAGKLAEKLRTKEL